MTTGAHGPHGWPATTCVTGFTSTSDEEDDEVGEGDDPEASTGFGFGFVVFGVSVPVRVGFVEVGVRVVV